MNLNKHKGHKLFSLNLITGEIKECDTGTPEIRKQILYASSLNKKNAMKRFDKMINHLLKK